MKKGGDSRKFLTIALAVGVLANAGGKPAFAKDRHARQSAEQRLSVTVGRLASLMHASAPLKKYFRATDQPPSCSLDSSPFSVN
jgi:hypothetical protein